MGKKRAKREKEEEKGRKEGRKKKIELVSGIQKSCETHLYIGC
jgi:hypothetical protein